MILERREKLSKRTMVGRYPWAVSKFFVVNCYFLEIFGKRFSGSLRQVVKLFTFRHHTDETVDQILLRLQIGIEIRKVDAQSTANVIG